MTDFDGAPVARTLRDGVYEKLGLFYLGRPLDFPETPLLYDSSDLVTHGVIVGMTGSGKTGLGIDLIEECAIDSVPVIAIDPKGGLGNLLLTFPRLAAEDFLPWVDRDHGHGVDGALFDQVNAQSGLAAAGHADDHAVRDEI